MNKKLSIPAVKNKEGWLLYPTSDMVFPYAKCFWQKCIYTYGKSGVLQIYANFIQYDEIPGKKDYKTWQLNIQVPEDFNMLNKTINLDLFTYDKPDFNKAEMHAKTILNRLKKHT